MTKISDNRAYLETYSVVNMMGEKLTSWNDKEINPNSKLDRFVGHILKPLAIRVIGCVAVIFCALADLFMHLGLFLAKLVAAPMVLPARICVKNLSKELHLSSPLKHLINTFRSLIDVVFLPGLWLLDPKAAYEHAAIHMSNKSAKTNHKKSGITALPSPLKTPAKDLKRLSSFEGYPVLPPAISSVVESCDNESEEETGSTGAYEDETVTGYDDDFIRRVPMSIDFDSEGDKEDLIETDLNVSQAEESFKSAFALTEPFTFIQTSEEQHVFDQEFNVRKKKIDAYTSIAFKSWCASLKDLLSDLSDRYQVLKETLESRNSTESSSSDFATPEKKVTEAFGKDLSTPAKNNFQTVIKKVNKSDNLNTIEREIKLYKKLMQNFEPRLREIVQLQRGNTYTSSEKQLEANREKQRVEKEKAEGKQSLLKAVSFVEIFYEKSIDIKEKLKEKISLKKALLDVNRILAPTDPYDDLSTFYERMELLQNQINADNEYDENEYNKIQEIVTLFNNPTFYQNIIRSFQ